MLGLLLSSLAMNARSDGDYDSARRLAEESLALRRKRGTDWAVARSLILVGHIALDVAEPEVALQAFREALTIVRRVGDRRGLAESLAGLARYSKEPATAMRLAAAADVLLEAAGAQYRDPLLVATDDHVRELRAQLGPRAAAIEAEARAMSLDDAMVLAQETAGLC